MMGDETFYDPSAATAWKNFSITAGEFGGYTRWCCGTLPCIGDDRNQFDFYRDQPERPEGLRELSRDFHRQNVVFGITTRGYRHRRKAGTIDALALLVQAIEADGIASIRRAGRGGIPRPDTVRPGVVRGRRRLPLKPSTTITRPGRSGRGQRGSALRNKWLNAATCSTRSNGGNTITRGNCTAPG